MREPLTRSELRRMNGEPIYVMPLTGNEKPHWEICTYNLYDLSVFGNAWVAYKEKPKGGVNDGMPRLRLL